MHSALGCWFTSFVTITCFHFPVLFSKIHVMSIWFPRCGFHPHLCITFIKNSHTWNPGICSLHQSYRRVVLADRTREFIPVLRVERPKHTDTNHFHLWVCCTGELLRYVRCHRTQVHGAYLWRHERPLWRSVDRIHFLIRQTVPTRMGCMSWGFTQLSTCTDGVWKEFVWHSFYQQYW